MLITISGMVGSGKSTTASWMITLLNEAGLEARAHRFRFLNLPGFEKRKEHEGSQEPQVQDRGTQRGSGFSVRRLTASRAAGYALRILSFRLSSIGSASRCDVLDRYFYDNFVQYSLKSSSERFYFRCLRWLIPRPDAAILLVASDASISARRSNYVADYVTTAGRRYTQLPAIFPNLIVVRTDPDQQAEAQIGGIVQQLVARHFERRGSARGASGPASGPRS